MQLIFEEDDFYIKYSVEIDVEELTKIRKILIEKFSKITHMNYKTTILPKKDYHIRNYNEEKIGVREYNDIYSFNEDEYIVDYDYYEEPYLVILINSLLRGDTNSINDIEEYLFEEDDELDKELLSLFKQKILNCIKLTEISRIEKEQVLKVKDFFGYSMEYCSENIKKVKQKKMVDKR